MSHCKIIFILVVAASLGFGNNVSQAATISYAADQSTDSGIEIAQTTLAAAQAGISLQTASVFDVPFYSQLTDISAVKWKKVGCGIASLAMLIDYYEPEETTVDALLAEGLRSGAYISNAGWSHRGLVLLANDHGLAAAARDFSSNTMTTAFAKIKQAVEEGPVIASVHYTFDPKNPIPHLVVIRGIKDDRVYYNDPALGGGSISINTFKKSWKKRYIEVRPAA